MNTKAIDGAALLAELREVFGCRVSLEGRVKVRFPKEKPRDLWAELFIKAHLEELRAALLAELPQKERAA